MGKYNYMNLNQKMIRIRKKVPKLIRKRYSEDVTYDFVKLDDISGSDHTVPFTGHSGCSRIVFL